MTPDGAGVERRSGYAVNPTREPFAQTSRGGNSALGIFAYNQRLGRPCPARRLSSNEFGSLTLEEKQIAPLSPVILAR